MSPLGQSVDTKTAKETVTANPELKRREEKIIASFERQKESFSSALERLSDTLTGISRDALELPLLRASFTLLFERVWLNSARLAMASDDPIMAQALESAGRNLNTAIKKMDQRVKEHGGFKSKSATKNALHRELLKTIEEDLGQYKGFYQQVDSSLRELKRFCQRTPDHVVAPELNSALEDTLKQFESANRKLSLHRSSNMLNGKIDPGAELEKIFTVVRTIAEVEKIAEQFLGSKNQILRAVDDLKEAELTQLREDFKKRTATPATPAVAEPDRPSMPAPVQKPSARSERRIQQRAERQKLAKELGIDVKAGDTLPRGIGITALKKMVSNFERTGLPPGYFRYILNEDPNAFRKAPKDLKKAINELKEITSALKGLGHSPEDFRSLDEMRTYVREQRGRGTDQSHSKPELVDKAISRISERIRRAAPETFTEGRFNPEAAAQILLHGFTDGAALYTGRKRISDTRIRAQIKAAIGDEHYNKLSPDLSAYLSLFIRHGLLIHKKNSGYALCSSPSAPADKDWQEVVRALFDYV
ncbi:MAG: hypothetical protein D6719_11365, partial [Candidatus Dadabacteria bacterium]